MKKLFITLVSALLLISASAFAQVQTLPIDPDVKYGVLDNGLTYYIRHNEEPKGLVNFYIAQKVGSVQEEDSQRGLAHFLEHMCFNGTVNFPGDRIVKYCESIGVKFGQNLNAYTSTDETVYNIDDIPVTENNIDSCLLILHDWADGLLLETEEIDKERGVIHEEWRMRSSAQQRILERALPVLYPGSKYGVRMPIGLMEVIDNFSPEFLRNYYETWYRPDLQGVVIVGDIDPAQIEAKIKAVFGPIKMPENPKKFEEYPVPSNEHAIYVVEKDKEQQQPLIYMMFKTEPMSKELKGTAMYYMEDYLTTIMGSVLNARLTELSQKPDSPFIVAEAAYGKFLIAKTMDALTVVVMPKNGQDEQAVKAAMIEVERARRFGLTGTEVYRAKEEFLSEEQMLYDNRNKTRSVSYVNEYVRHFIDGDAIPGKEIEHQLYQTIAPQVTAEMMSQTLQQLTESVDKDFVVFAMYPDKEGQSVPTADQIKKAIEDARASDIEPYVDNVKDEPLVSVLPAPGKIKKQSASEFGYTKIQLANGANVYYKKTDFNDSQVLMSAVSKGGYSRLPLTDIVNASLVSDVINNQGLGNFNSIELEKALAGKQASCSVSLSLKTEGLSGSSTPKDLETLFQLIYLRFQEPADDPDAYESLMTMLRSSLENQSKLPTAALQDSLTRTIYGGNPWTKTVKLEDLDKADYETIKKIYRDRFSSTGDFDFFFTGAFDEDLLKQYVAQYIAPFPKVKRREVNIEHNVYPVEGVITNKFTREMETPQAYIVQVWSGKIPVTPESEVVVDAVGSILSQKYLKSIREDGGMAYSVSTQGQTMLGDKELYLFQTVCPFTPALCDSVLFLMKQGIDEIAKDGVSEAEISDVQKFELKDFQDNQRKNAYWSSMIQSFVVYGKDFNSGRENAINALSSDSIKKFVNDHLVKDNNCQTVIMLPEDMTE
ncbi:MAG: insulinase family protein [Bacteroidales bacterium]|nr:insulinase family protein [Bacteroidales bacterium]